MVECTKDYVRECVKNRVPPKDIEAFLSEAAKKLRSEDFYCKDGLFSPPVLTNEQKKEIPCNETFYDESRVCGDTFQTKFRSNRADKTLCKYATMHVYYMYTVTHFPLKLRQFSWLLLCRLQPIQDLSLSSLLYFILRMIVWVNYPFGLCWLHH